MTIAAEAALKEYEEKNVNWQCMYPAILIRVLPKNMITKGGIVLLEQDNHKPLYEAIVLRVYEPKTIKKNGNWVLMEAGVKPGDHILFPWWSGEAVPGLSEIFASTTGLKNDEYRLIPALGAASIAGNKEAGEPVLILEYEKEDVRHKLQNILTDKIAKYCDRLESIDRNRLVNNAIAEIIKDFDILVKVKDSKIRQ